MTIALTSQEYWAQVAALAQEVTKEAHDEDRDVFEVLNETLDQHNYVIYTAKALCVLLHSPNDGAYLEDTGSLPSADCMSDLYAALAHAALQADVVAHSDFNADVSDEEEEV